MSWGGKRGEAVLDEAVLDDPVGESLRGAHAHLARRLGEAAVYEPDVATFAAVPARPGPSAWADLAALLGPGEFADMFSCPAPPPDTWEPVFTLPGLQLTAPEPPVAAPVAAPTAAPGLAPVIELAAADVPDMLGLVERTRPGPFMSRTHELGTYLGIRENGRLVAMAGERLRPPGWTEISAVCTAPEARGRGHAARLVRALTARIASRDERAFLHAAEANTAAVALYKRLGFEVRKPVTFRGFRVPTSHAQPL